jgi:O-antigen ligase
MNSMKALQWAGIVLGPGLALYLFYPHYLQYFSNITFLGGVLLLEIILASFWKYSERFFPLLLIAFVWAGLSVPLQGAWTAGRWVVLAAGAIVGFVLWTKNPQLPFRSFQLMAFFCVCAGVASATVSQYSRMATLKALSLLLLFTYCASGGRLALAGREDRFFRGLLAGCEITVFGTAVCYLGLNQEIWGNRNSLGAVMGAGLFPILLWGWQTSVGPVTKARRLTAIAVCGYLILFSVARAGMASVVVVSVFFCVGLHQYKLLVKGIALLLVLVAVIGMLDPAALNQRMSDLRDAVLYKGHKSEGLLGSRRTPWEKTIASIKEHPYFGTGYGTSPTGAGPGLSAGTTSSNAEAAREHGSSYMAITEWVGLLGVLPFAALLTMTAWNVRRVFAWMRRTAAPRDYSIPLAMVVLAGLVHAIFEDWLFAPGYYLCVYFWFLAFLLDDVTPTAGVAASAVPRALRRWPAGFGSVVPGR